MTYPSRREQRRADHMKGNHGKLRALILGSLMVLVATAACVEKPAPVNKAPVAVIGAPAESAIYDTGAVISFDGSGSYDPEKKPLTFAWSFGDNSTATGNRTTHSYALPGRYLVTLKVDDGKKSGTDRVELELRQANRAPQARFRASNTTVSNEEQVAFNASGTTDEDNDPLTFIWSFGDGTAGQGREVLHLYPAAGSYNVTLNVTDGKANSAAMLSITVHQANRAPVPALAATPPVTFPGAIVEFDASGSTDADNDTLTAAWDFGDGSNATGLRASHSYARFGNFTAVVTVRDGKAERSKEILVTVLPKARILVDWNRSDYGYIIQTEQAVGKANLTVSVSSSNGGTDGAAAITELASDRFRAKSTVLPARGETLNVTVMYWGHVIGARTMTVYENMPMPGRNCTVTFDASMSNHKMSETAEEWFNVSGSVGVAVSDLLAEYSMRLAEGSVRTVKRTGDGKTTVGSAMIAEGWFNQTLDAGMQTSNRMELSTSGDSTTTDLAGSKLERFKIAQQMVKVGHNLTFVSLSMNGTQYGYNVTITVTTLGLGERDNGAGKLFPCIRLRFNYTVDGYNINETGALVHQKVFSEETQWNVQDEDHYTNTTIYREFSKNEYLVDDGTGKWTLISNVSDKEWPDSDGDGRYNPDAKPTGSDEAFAFHGLVPRELLVGDRMAATNEHDVTVVIEARDGGLRTVDGVTYAVILLNGTFSGAGGSAGGDSESWIISQGNLTGLSVESRERKRWAGGENIEESLGTFKAVRIKEE